MVMELTFRMPGRRAVVNAEDVVDGFRRAALAAEHPECVELVVGDLDVEAFDQHRFVAGEQEYVITYALGGQRPTGRQAYLWADKR